MSKGRWIKWLVLGMASVSACRYEYEELSMTSSAGGESSDAGAPTVEKAGSSAVAGSASEGGEPSLGGSNSQAAAGATSGSSGDGGSAGSAGASGNGGSGGSGGSGGAADLVVTTGIDENDAGASVAMPGGAGLSLREAITIANNTAGSQTIAFQGGIMVALSSALPNVTDGVTILGGVVDGSAAPNNTDCVNVWAGPTTFDGLRINGCKNRPLYVQGGNDVHVQNCTFDGGGHSVEVASSTGTGTVIGPGNIITNITGHCLAIYNSGAQVLDNRILDCSSNGIFLSGSAIGTSLIGNVIARGTAGIGMGNGASGTKLWHNTVSQCSSGVNVGSASANDLRNNILVFNAQYGIIGADARFSQNDYNLIFGNTSGMCNACTPGANTVQLDPRFVNAAADNYTLQVGSPAVNAGTPLGGDRNGAAAGNFNGAAPDIGYWEQ